MAAIFAEDWTPEGVEWVAAHLKAGTNPLDLRLKHGSSRPYSTWISQLEAHKKVATKLPTLLNSWVFPEGVPLQQSSSESTAQYKATLLPYPLGVDLSTGIGVDAHFLSNGEAFSAVEPNPDLGQLYAHNLPHATWFERSAEEFIAERLSHQKAIEPAAQTAYIDPHRRDGAKRLYSIEDCVPNLFELEGDVLQLYKALLSKHSPMAQLKELLALKNVHAIWAVQKGGDCRELLVLQRNEPATRVALTAVDLDRATALSRNIEAGVDAHVTPPMSPELGPYLYELGPAGNKLHMGATVCSEHGLHWTGYGGLYSAPAVIDALKGKWFEVLEESAPYKLKSEVQAGAIERIGFPERPEQIRAKLRWKEGRAHKLWALKSGKSKSMLLGKRIDIL